jgi:hypothetical protein
VGIGDSRLISTLPARSHIPPCIYRAEVTPELGQKNLLSPASSIAPSRRFTSKYRRRITFLSLPLQHLVVGGRASQFRLLRGMSGW